jgi:hypothetical protein
VREDRRESGKKEKSSTDPLSLSSFEILQTVRSCLVDLPTNFRDCVLWARRKFEELFSSDVKQLLHNFPPDSLNSSGGKKQKKNTELSSSLSRPSLSLFFTFEVFVSSLHLFSSCFVFSISSLFVFLLFLSLSIISLSFHLCLSTSLLSFLQPPSGAASNAPQPLSSSTLTTAPTWISLSQQRISKHLSIRSNVRERGRKRKIRYKERERRP